MWSNRECEWLKSITLLGDVDTYNITVRCWEFSMHLSLSLRNFSRASPCYTIFYRPTEQELYGEQGWHHTIFYNWILSSFSKKKSNHLMSSKHRSYSVLLQISWNYRAKGPMSATSNVNCAESWNITMVLFAGSEFFALKPKTQCIGWKKLGFPLPWWGKMLMKSTVDRKSHNDWYKIVWECWSGIKSI